MNIRQVMVEGHPLRRLKLMCDVSVPGSLDVCVLDSWVTVTCPDWGIHIAEGKLFHVLNNRNDAAVLTPNTDSFSEIVIPLPPNILRDIEEHRSGTDNVELTVISRVLACYSHSTKELRKPGLSAPFETSLEDNAEHQMGYFKYTIPQSEWVKHLRLMQWSDIELLELPSGAFSPSPEFNRAVRLLDEAQSSFLNGDWKATMMHCRRAVEAAAYDLSGEPEKKKAPLKELARIIPEEKKSACIDELLKYTGQFCHLGRHESGKEIAIGRDDALLALQVTASLLRYLSKYTVK